MRKHAPAWEEGMPRIEPALEQAGRSAAELQRRDGPARAVMAEQQQRVAALIPHPHPSPSSLTLIPTPSLTRTLALTRALTPTLTPSLTLTLTLSLPLPLSLPLTLTRCRPGRRR